MSTLPLAGTSRDTVATLRAEVVGGSDAGRSSIAEGETLTVGTANGNDLVLADPTVSRYHLELQRDQGGVLVVDHGSTNGTRVGAVLVERAIVPPGTTLLIGRTALRITDGAGSAVDLLDADRLCDLRGRTPAMRRLMAQIVKVSLSEVSVLIVGESGTGKELVAQAVHKLGPRAARPLVTVDCGALPPTLIASELFGHDRGAFTGADRAREGAFERAGSGTVFLDEIGELPPDIQSTLLGVLERRSFRRVGGTADIEMKARALSATHRDLRAAVNQGRFRLDLYYRVAVVSLKVEPLRARSEDVPMLVEHFLRESGHEGGGIEAHFPPAVMETLRSHFWPGNVRELRNFVEATIAMGERPSLPAGDVPLEAHEGEQEERPPEEGQSYREARTAALHQFEARYLRGVLGKTAGNVSGAARIARMDRSYLVELLRKHGIR